MVQRSIFILTYCVLQNILFVILHLFEFITSFTLKKDIMWKIIVEVLAVFVPKKYRYKTRAFLHSIWNYIYVKTKAAKVGKGFTCGHGYPCSVSKRTFIGDNVSIGSCYVLGSGNFYIGNNTHIGPFLTVTTDNHNYEGNAIPYDKTVIKKDVVIEENCWLGVNVTLLPGTKIREGSVIQAGSVVHGEIPPLSIAGGNPAKVFAQRDKEHYKRLKAENKTFANL